jgi:predicted RNase H-like nuclease
MPKVIIVRNEKAGRVSVYCKGKGIPVQDWKKVYKQMQLDADMLESMVNSLNKK